MLGYLANLLRKGGLFVPLRKAFMVPDIRGRVAIVCGLSVFLGVRAVAQEGYYGAGHDKLHQGFVGFKPVAVARVAILAADLAELAGPIRQDERCARIGDCRVASTVGAVEVVPQISPSA